MMNGNDMMGGFGGAMWGMGLVWLLALLVLGLGAAALAKYLFSSPRRRMDGNN